MTLKDGFKFGIGFYFGTTVIKAIDEGVSKGFMDSKLYQKLRFKTVNDSEDKNDRPNVIGFGHKY